MKMVSNTGFENRNAFLRYQMKDRFVVIKCIVCVCVCAMYRCMFFNFPFVFSFVLRTTRDCGGFTIPNKPDPK